MQIPGRRCPGVLLCLVALTAVALLACAREEPPTHVAQAARPTSPPSPPTAQATMQAPAEGDLLRNVQWLGHAAFRITGEKVIYIDPYRLQTDQPADIILITHEHGDHCSPGDVDKVRGPQTVIVAPADCASKLGGEVQVVKPGDALTVQGIPIEVVPAYNIGKSFHPQASGWVGYIITANGVRIYHAGDTDHIPEMDTLQVDVALLPAGGRYTMDARQAAEAANAMKPRLAVPMHWGSVAGSRSDAEQFVQACQVPAQIMEPQP